MKNFEHLIVKLCSWSIVLFDQIPPLWKIKQSTVELYSCDRVSLDFQEIEQSIGEFYSLIPFARYPFYQSIKTRHCQKSNSWSCWNKRSNAHLTKTTTFINWKVVFLRKNPLIKRSACMNRSFISIEEATFGNLVDLINYSIWSKKVTAKTFDLIKRSILGVSLVLLFGSAWSGSL